MLTLADRAAPALSDYPAADWVAGTLRRRHPRVTVRQSLQRLDLPPDIDLHLADGAGRVWATTVGPWAEGPASREALKDLLATAPVGVASAVVLDDTWTDLVRRDTAWQEFEVCGLAGRVMVERQRVLAKDDAHPWSGKWTGAYSREAMHFTTDTPAAARDASALSAIILQAGDSCWIRLVTGDEVFQSRGTVHGHVLRAGAADPVRILDLTYSPEDQRLRGTLESVAPDRTSTARIFLQRVGPE